MAAARYARVAAEMPAPSGAADLVSALVITCAVVRPPWPDVGPPPPIVSRVLGNVGDGGGAGAGGFGEAESG